MIATCPACGPVSPRESSGTAALGCPHCGREVAVAPVPYATTYAAAPEAPSYQGVYPPPAGYGPYPGFQVPPGQPPRHPAILAARYDSWIVARRWLSTLVDHLALAATVFLPLLLANALLNEDSFEKTLPIWLLPALLYFPVLEGKFGVTPGKWLAGLRVVGADGRAPGFWRASVRTLMRLVEVNPFLLGGIIAGIAVLASRSRQRLGDRLAGTYVLTAADARIARQPTDPPAW